MGALTDNDFASGIPSSKLELLRTIVGGVVTSLTRYSWSPPDEAVSEWNIDPEKLAFSLTAGPLLIELGDGTRIGAASDPSLISVILWAERDRGGREREPRLADDDELHPIPATDERYAPAAIRKLIGLKIEAVRILKRQPELAKWEAYPCEAGVLIEFAGGGKILLSHGLHDDSDDFSVITPGQVKSSLVARLTDMMLVT
ncbi:hypothetical protein [Gemmata sp.]|uniref:hypothetical protein n=1 Tax=Gemmata sp. TaxID=1914242 RepID=UPI003F6E4792